MCWLSKGGVGRKQCLRWQKQQWWCCCHPTEDRNPHNNDNDDDLTTVMIKLEIDVWKRRRQRNRGRDAVWTRSPPESHRYPGHWIRIVVGWWVRWNLIYVSKPFEFVHIFSHLHIFRVFQIPFLQIFWTPDQFLPRQHFTKKDKGRNWATHQTNFLLNSLDHTSSFNWKSGFALLDFTQRVISLSEMYTWY